ncbi:hypothetical protein B0T18DRAFT_441625 [Schizothecium vesticola]|uniref:DUF676 domain-containing protein n=1 Tax=Schizothecium vesticola TaxID=314040 RepID=A0AA40F8B7_9PEZI|nr:hypothetical protein B0T18DRAFT_441625 [Schizothecium vesticola]
MKRILLLCFIHGFKGNDDTFGDFPKHLEDTVTNNLPDDKVTSVVYPRYETKGELAQSSTAFLEWLKEQVMNLRKEHLDTPWPPNDRSVGVILVAHSMGGFIASDALFQILDARHHHPSPTTAPLFPLIQGILAFDTPYNGLARSMFVYGAFSNYQKVSNVFNVMTALSAAAPATLSRLATKRAVARATTAPRSSASSPAWKAWQLLAVRTGTVGAIAAGGVAAYTHRREILQGVRTVRGLRKEDVVAGYQSSVDALGQGLAYVNRGNVGASFAWLSEHVTFVGALLRPKEMGRRLERLAALKGVGVADFYASLGENGVWSGGYFVPERTFCAVPGEGQEAAGMFRRCVVRGAEDEVVAHVGMFKRKNGEGEGYEEMVSDAAKLVVQWFGEETEVWDDPKFAEPVPEEKEEKEIVVDAVEGVEATEEALKKEGEDDAIPDESPIDIAAAASLVPLPDDNGFDAEEKAEVSEQKKAYMRHLFGIAQETGSSLWSNIPTKLPTVDMPKVSMPSVSMPGIPSMPTIPAMPSMSMPGMGLFSKKSNVSSTTAESKDADKGVEVEVSAGGKDHTEKVDEKKAEGSETAIAGDGAAK